MRKIVSIIILAVFTCYCTRTETPKELQPEVINREKENVLNVIKQYNKAFEDKNFAGIIETLSEDVIFFGTDSAETIKSLSQFKDVIQKQWNEIKATKYGEIMDISIQMDKMATLASIIYGCPCDFTIDHEVKHFFLRFERTLKKEKGKWMIVSGVVGIANTATTPPDLMELQKKINEKEKEEKK